MWGRAWLVVVVVVALSIGCGGVATPGGNDDNPQLITLAFTSGGTSSHAVIANLGSQLLVVNNDLAPHQFASNPHATHAECPELNGPLLEPGQSFNVTLTRAMSCGFHDHLNPTNGAFQGIVAVSGPQ
jgi:hypothetical protein